MRRTNADGRYAGTARTAKVARVGEHHQRPERRLEERSGDAKHTDGKTHEKDVGTPDNADGQFLCKNHIAFIENQK